MSCARRWCRTGSSARAAPRPRRTSTRWWRRSSASRSASSPRAMRDARPAASSAPALARAVDFVFLWPGYLAGVLYFVLAFFVTYDVLARKWGAAVGLPTTRVTDEISGYLLALAATWGFAFTLRTGGHVRVDVVFPYLARGVRTAIDVLAQLLMAVFAGLIAWKIWTLVLDSLETDARS